MDHTAPSGTQILPIAEEHIEGFRACLDAVARERRYIGFLEAPPLESVRGFLRENIGRGLPQCVAVADGLVVGWCDIIPLTREGFAHCGHMGMGVHPAWRGQGIGRRLLERTLAWAREIGLQRVELEVYASNTRAIGLYESSGFETEGVKKNARKLEGDAGPEYDDVITMALFLR